MKRRLQRSPAAAADPGPKFRRIEEQAADWISRRNGRFTAKDEAEFQAWLDLDPRHSLVLRELERTWIRFSAPRESGCADAVYAEINLLRRARTRRRRLRWSAFGLAASVALLSAAYFSRPSATVSAQAATVPTRPIIRSLEDGSKVALRSGAEIEVAFSANQRRVRLVRGEALFTVARDLARPFVVSSGEVEVRAVGTEFTVDRGRDVVTVVVTEGRIAITESAVAKQNRNAASASVLASAGERVVVPVGPSGLLAPPVVTPLASSDLASTLAWRGRRLEFSDTPLREALAQVNRGRDIQLVLAEPWLEQRTITGILWADDSEGLVRLLEQGFNLTAEREGGIIRLRTRQ